MKLKIICSALASLGIITGSADAHPGSKILTLGGQAERSAMSAGVSFEEKNGVHLFRGGQTAERTAMSLHGGSAHRYVEIEIDKRKSAFRSIRTLRTQGFYSGSSPKSRRYTQGFFAGN